MGARESKVADKKECMSAANESNAISQDLPAGVQWDWFPDMRLETSDGIQRMQYRTYGASVLTAGTDYPSVVLLGKQQDSLKPMPRFLWS